MTSERIGVALVGTGIFSFETHVPTWLKIPQVDIVAVCGRSQAGCDKLAQKVTELSKARGFGNSEVKTFFGDDALEQTLKFPSVQAVSIVLPPAPMANAIKMCLDAGKHVFSEKPLAIDVATGRELCQMYEQVYKPKGLLWVVGENYRSETAFIEAAKQVESGIIGTVQTAELVVHSPMNPQNKYFATEWRSRPVHNGGYLLDGGVHFVAALRFILQGINAAENKINVTNVVGLPTQISADLPSPDTVAGVLTLSNNAIASIHISFAPSQRRFEIRITGSNGTISVDRGTTPEGQPGYSVTTQLYPLNQNKPQVKVLPFFGVDAEMQAFAHTICPNEATANSAYLLPLLTPQQALDDIRIVHALIGVHPFSQ